MVTPEPEGLTERRNQDVNAKRTRSPRSETIRRIFYEEFLKDQQGKKGIAVYKEMSENDDTIGAILFSIEMWIRQATWDVQPGGTTSAHPRCRCALCYVEVDK